MTGAYSADEGRDESYTGLRAGNSLTKAKEESEVAVDAIIALEFPSSLDTLPGGSDLDQDTILLDANALVQRDELLGLGLGGFLVE